MTADLELKHTDRAYKYITVTSEMSCRSNDLSVKANVGLLPKMAILSTISLTTSQGSQN